MAENEYDLSRIDLDTETSEEAICLKIEDELRKSDSYWQELRSKWVDYLFDFLAFKENMKDTTKSNIALPTPFQSVRTFKARLKSSILGTRPWVEVDERYIPNLQANLLSLTYDTELEEAGWELFLDLLIQDTLIFGNGIYYIGWKKDRKLMPMFDEFGMPEFDPTGERTFAPQVIYDGLDLRNISIFSHRIPANATDFETADWVALDFNADILSLEKETYSYLSQDPYTGEFIPNEKSLYKNLRRISSKSSAADQDTVRAKTATKEAYGSVGQLKPLFVEFWTDQKVFVKPKGEQFLIRNDQNPYRSKPIKSGCICPLTNSPYGIGIVGIAHKMNRTQWEIMDVVLDGLWKEDNKQWIYNKNAVNPAELQSRQSGLIGVDIDAGLPVNSAVQVIETRALATEVLPLLNMFDLIFQKTTGATDVAKGIAPPGAETAFEVNEIMQGLVGIWEDSLKNLEATLGQKLFPAIADLNRLFFTREKEIAIMGEDKQIQSYLVTPQDVWLDCRFKYSWAKRQVQKQLERAQITNMLQVISQIPIQSWNPAIAMLVQQLLVYSGISNADQIAVAVQQSMEQAQIQIAADIQQQQGQLQLQQQAQQQQGQQNEIRNSMDIVKQISDQNAVSMKR